MDIIFYKLQDEANDVKKTRTLTATASYTPKTIAGYLRGSTSKITPSIEFACDITQFNDWNYCYIADFKRYYFVMDVISVRAGVTAVDLKVDVLTSFLTPANQNTVQGFIGRCSNSSLYNTKIPDSKVQFTTEKYMVVDEPTDRTNALTNVTFSPTASNNILVSVINVNDYPTYTDITIPSDLKFLTNNTATIDSDYFRPIGSVYMYVTDLNDVYTWIDQQGNPVRASKISAFLWYCVVESNQASFVNSVMIYPFSLPKDNTLRDVYVNLSKAWYLDANVGTDEIQMYTCTKPNSGYLILKDFILTYPTLYDHNDFMKYEPYTTCEIYIPYIGWQSIDIKNNLGDRLIVTYTVDYVTGQASVMLINKTKEMVLLNSKAQIGIEIPINKSNADELAIRQNNNAMSYGMGMLGSFIMGFAGLVSDNPLLIAGSVTGMLGSTGQYINNNNLLIPKGQGQTMPYNASSGTYSGLDVLVKWTITLSSNFHTSNDRTKFIKQLGIPTNKICKLEDIPVTGDYHTYAEIVDLHTTSEDGLYSLKDITSPEIEELKRLCAEGIYL